MPLRLLLIGLSAAGMLSAGVLWAMGHVLWAAQVLAGDVLAMFLILLVI